MCAKGRMKGQNGIQLSLKGSCKVLSSGQALLQLLIMFFQSSLLYSLHSSHRSPLGQGHSLARFTQRCFYSWDMSPASKHTAQSSKGGSVPKKCLPRLGAMWSQKDLKQNRDEAEPKGGSLNHPTHPPGSPAQQPPHYQQIPPSLLCDRAGTKIQVFVSGIAPALVQAEDANTANSVTSTFHWGWLKDFRDRGK